MDGPFPRAAAEGFRAGSPDQAMNAQRREELEALYTISGAVHSSLELDRIQSETLERVLKVFGFTAGVIRLLNASTGELVVSAISGVSDDLKQELNKTLRIGEGVSGLAARERALVVIEDLAAAGFRDSVWVKHGYRSLASAPLLCNDMLLGCLNIASRQRDAFPQERRPLLEAMASQVAMAVANAELYAGARRKIEQLSLLQQCSRDIGRVSEMHQVLSLVCDRLGRLLGFDRVAVFMRDTEDGSLRGAASYGYTEEAVKAVVGSPDELPAAAAVLESRRLWITEEPAEEGLLPADFVRREAAGSILAIPLAADEAVLGILVGDRRGELLLLTPDELDLAMIFANQASVWIERARSLGEAIAAEAKFRDLLEVAPDAIILVDGDGNISLVNSKVEQMFGVGRDTLIGRSIDDLIPERYRKSHTGHRAKFLLQARARPLGSGLELHGRRWDGSEFPAEISISPATRGGGGQIIVIIRDVTERRQAEKERLQLLKREREKSEQLKLAIREAHHRIKNNLQAISDLLYLELGTGDGAPSGDHLQNSIERIQSIALVHDLLSLDEDVETVDSKALIERLAPMVLRSGRHPGEAQRLKMEVASFLLTSKQGTNLALIVNELVSNAGKHALGKGNSEPLQISLFEEAGDLVLRVRDSGPGLPAGFDLNRDANVGLQVVRTLAERDLAGKFSLSIGTGLSAQVRFPRRVNNERGESRR
jgi:PAS domain S-box-containing protein